LKRRGSHIDRDKIGVLSFAGLGQLAASPLTRDVQSIRLRDHDLVEIMVDHAGIRRLGAGSRDLAVAEDLFLMIGGGPMATRRDLANLRVSRDGVLRGIELRNRLFPGPRPRKVAFNTFVKQDQDQRIHRREIASRVNGEIFDLFPGWRISDPASLEVWCFFVDARVRLGLRLTDERYRYRGRQPIERPDALRPTIAAAMVALADLSAGIRVLDPMCGGGTLLAEAARVDGVHVRGGDLDGEAVRIARSRDPDIQVDKWDATALAGHVAAGQVDRVICNLPFGRQYSHGADMAQLYESLIGHWRGLMATGGRLILLSSDDAAMKRALGRLHLRRQREERVKVLGLWSTISVVAAGPRPQAPDAVSAFGEQQDE